MVIFNGFWEFLPLNMVGRRADPKSHILA